MFDINFWKEFFAALYPTHRYENIKSPIPLIDINFILIGLYLGLVIGFIVTIIRKRYLGKVVRAIIKAEAFSPEDAKSPKELGFGNKKLLLYIVRHLSFSNPIKQAGVDTDKKRPDYTNEGYYIPENQRYSAEERYSTKGTSIGSVIFWIIFLIPIFLFLRFIIPELLVLFDNALSLK